MANSECIKLKVKIHKSNNCSKPRIYNWLFDIPIAVLDCPNKYGISSGSSSSSYRQSYGCIEAVATVAVLNG